MPYQFTVSPDFGPTQLSGWHIFNTYLQKNLGENIHLEIYDSFQAQRDAIQQDNVDLIYANPYEASMLVREKGFLPVARPKGKSDEIVIAVNAESSTEAVEDLEEGCRISSTVDPDVWMISMILLESADLNVSNISRTKRDSYILVAKDLLRGEADAGFFLAEAYEGLSSMVKKQLRPLVSSQIQVVHHGLMVGPALAGRRDELSKLMIAMESEQKGKGVLEGLEISGWDEFKQEEAEFMIDLMSTLET